MKKLLILVFTAIITVTSGCLPEPETSVPPRRYYTTYYLIYDETVNATLASAVFTADNASGFLQELSGAYDLEFNGNELQYDNNLSEYNFLFHEQLLDSGTFTYSDVDGGTYVNEVELVFIDYPAELDSINSTEEYELSWAGDPLEEGELVRLRIEDDDATVIFSIDQDNRGASSIRLTIPQLVQIGEGQYNLRLSKLTVSPTVQDPGVGGNIVTSIFLNSRPVVIY